MKKALLFMLCFFSVSAFAQDEWFIQSEGGVGFGGVRGISSNYQQHKERVQSENVIDYGTQITIARERRKVISTTGIGYLRTGFGDPTIPLIPGKYYNRLFNHIVVPATIGYKIGLGRGCAMVPTAGLYFAYNSSGRETIIYTPHFDPDKTEFIPHSVLVLRYHSLSVFSTVRVNFEFSLSRHIDLAISPTFDYMLSSMRGGLPSQHNYAYLLNAGIKWQLTKNEKTKRTTEDLK